MATLRDLRGALETCKNSGMDTKDFADALKKAGFVGRTRNVRSSYFSHFVHENFPTTIIPVSNDPSRGNKGRPDNACIKTAREIIERLIERAEAAEKAQEEGRSVPEEPAPATVEQPPIPLATILASLRRITEINDGLTGDNAKTDAKELRDLLKAAGFTYKNKGQILSHPDAEIEIPMSKTVNNVSKAVVAKAQAALEKVYNAAPELPAAAVEGVPDVARPATGQEIK